MHHLIQRGKVRSQVINIPEGLPELLSDITREVLRCQPTTECLCQFIIDYLHSVIVTREKASIAKSIIDRALRVVNEVIADMCICDIPQVKAEKMCTAMEECFRRFLAQRRCERGKDKEIIKFNEIDMLDELIQKCKFTDDELKISRPIIEAAYQKFVDAYMTANESTDGTDSLYQYFREREIKRTEERLRTEAAIKIQSSFRGFRVRKSMFSMTPYKPPLLLDLQEAEDEKQKELAARKIQNFFRRHMGLKDHLIHDSEAQLPDPCTPVSNLSLTARPADHHDLREEETFEKEKQPIEPIDHHEEKHDPEEISQNVDNVKEIQEDTQIIEAHDEEVNEEITEAATENKQEE